MDQDTVGIPAHVAARGALENDATFQGIAVFFTKAVMCRH